MGGGRAEGGIQPERGEEPLWRQFWQWQVYCKDTGKKRKGIPLFGLFHTARFLINLVLAEYLMQLNALAGNNPLETQH